MTASVAPAVAAGVPGVAASVVDLEAEPSLREAWERRRRSLPTATLFAGPLFQGSLRRAFDAAGPAAGIVVRRDGALAGVLPLARLPLRHGAVALHEAGFPRNPHTLRNHLLMDRDPAAAAALLSAWRQRPGADTLLLENLPAPEGSAELLAAAARDLGLRADDPTPGRVLDHADLPGSFEAFLATRSGQMRRQLRAKRRDVEAAGRLDIEALTGEAIRSSLAAWRQVVDASWQGQEAEAATAERDWALHADLAGNGRLWLLRIRGRPVAALRMLEDDRAAYVHTMHFDASVRPLAPGVVLFDAMMRDACERGLPRVDFNGRSEFFSRWATGATEHRSVRIYRPTLKGRLAQAARRWRRRAAAA